MVSEQNLRNNEITYNHLYPRRIDCRSLPSLASYIRYGYTEMTRCASFSLGPLVLSEHSGGAGFWTAENSLLVLPFLNGNYQFN